MNSFNQLVSRIHERFGGRNGWTVSVEEPAKSEGTYFASVARPDGFVVEIEWQRHRGFGLVAGRNLVFGAGVDEVMGSVDATLERVSALVDGGVPTAGTQILELRELRKLRGLLQKDVANTLGISKSGLAQMEQPGALTFMQLDTLRRVIASMGGELVLKARFPGGSERQIAVD